MFRASSTGPSTSASSLTRLFHHSTNLPVPAALRYAKQRRPTSPSRCASTLNARSNHLGRSPKTKSRRPSQAPTPSSRKRQLIFLGGLGAWLFITYRSYVYFNAKAQAQIPDLVPEDAADRFEEIADTFDKRVWQSEMMMGLGWLRRALVRKAQGHVLEVSAGTGRNASYYRVRGSGGWFRERVGPIASVTFLDRSRQMLDLARGRFEAENPAFKKVRYLVQGAEERITAPPGGYDTVLQTMGICSVRDPVGVLKHLGSITNPRGGRILLLEHGRGHYDWINGILDREARGHAHTFGCWWNKDIGKIVEESGLEVVKIKRYHFGTTWWVELRPRGGTEPRPE